MSNMFFSLVAPSWVEINRSSFRSNPQYASFAPFMKRLLKGTAHARTHMHIERTIKKREPWRQTGIADSSGEWHRSPHKAKVNTSASPSITEQLRGWRVRWGCGLDHFQPNNIYMCERGGGCTEYSSKRDWGWEGLNRPIVSPSTHKGRRRQRIIRLICQELWLPT